jgi:hypothetical protein
MRKKTFKVVGHGEGPLAKKAIDLAVKHPKIEITAVEPLNLTYGKYLKSLKKTQKPSNLNVVKSGSVEYLSKQKANSIPHQYAHFSPTAMHFYMRRKFFSEVFRTLTPGGKFTIIEGGEGAVFLARELKKNGFIVSLKYLTSNEVRKVASPNAEMFAGQRESEVMKNRASIPSKEMEDLMFKLFMEDEPIKNEEVIAYNRLRAKRYAQYKLGANSFARIIATKPKK